MKKNDLRMKTNAQKEALHRSVLDRNQKGETILAISQETGIHRTTVSRWVKQNKKDNLRRGRKYQFSKSQYSDLRVQFATEILTQRFSLWSSKRVQQFLTEKIGTEISLFQAKKFIADLFKLPDKDIINKHLERAYPNLDGLTPAIYAKKNNLRYNYLFRVNAICGYSEGPDLLLIYSPRGDIRFAKAYYSEFFKELLLRSKNRLLLIHYRVFTKEEEQLYSGKFPEIFFIDSG